MPQVSHNNLVRKGRNRHERRRLKNPKLARAIAGGGRVMENGALRVEVPLVDGTTAVYRATPKSIWRFDLEPPHAHVRARLNGGAAPAPSPGEVAKQAIDTALGAIDTALGVLADIERRARTAQPEVETMKIAAE